MVNMTYSVVKVSAKSLSLVQRIPTECDVSKVCDREA
jgi:hypothetical protein